jgi:hypothetical protein
MLPKIVQDEAITIISLWGPKIVTIGKLEPVPLRELWKHEEHGFSVWLANNIEALSEELGISLTVEEREKKVGAFNVDLLAMDEYGNRVIVENQLERTDHDHLGKVLTYLTNLQAKTAIWIAAEASPEHITAMQWLNEVTPEDVTFCLVRLAAYRIGSSEPAPQFTVIVAPSAEGKSIGREKKELAEREVLRLRFWEQLLARAKAAGVMTHASVSPTKDQWLNAGAGRSGITFTYLIWTKEDKGGGELYIDTGDKERNKRIFDVLHAKQAEIERAFEFPLDWQRLDNRRSSRIRFLVGKGGLRDESRWPSIQEAMISGMERFSTLLQPYIRALP